VGGRQAPGQSAPHPPTSGFVANLAKIPPRLLTPGIPLRPGTVGRFGSLSLAKRGCGGTMRRTWRTMRVATGSTRGLRSGAPEVRRVRSGAPACAPEATGIPAVVTAEPSGITRVQIGPRHAATESFGRGVGVEDWSRGLSPCELDCAR